MPDIFDVLPNDILIDIFTLCLPPAEFPTPAQYLAPLILREVSRSWRDFIDSCPPLWRKLAVCYDPRLHNRGSGTSPEVVVRQLKLWKEKSQNTIHSFSLGIRHNLSIPDEPFIDLLLSFLIDNSRTLKRLDLALHSRRPRSSTQAFFTLPLRSLSALEDVSWRAPLLDTEVAIVDTYVRQTFHNLPPLRRFSVSHCTLGPGMVESITSWTTLTHLSLTKSQTSSTFYTIARRCTQLEFFSITVGGGDSETGLAHGSSTILSHLHTLKIVFIRRANPSFFHYLSFPSLVRFHLLSDTHAGAPTFSFKNYNAAVASGSAYPLNEFGKNLRYLTLGYHDLPYDRLIVMLRHTPLLVELRIDSQLCSYDEFLCALTAADSGASDGSNAELQGGSLLEHAGIPLVPLLESFELYIQLFDIPVVTFDSAVFWRMIESRVLVQVLSDSNNPSDNPTGAFKGSGDTMRKYPLRFVSLHVQNNEDTRLNFAQLKEEYEQRRSRFEGLVDVELYYDSDLTDWLVDSGDRHDGW